MNSLIDYLRELEKQSIKRAENITHESEFEEGYQDALYVIWDWISANKFNIEDRNGNEFPVIDVEDW